MFDNYFMCTDRGLANGVSGKMIVRMTCFRHSQRFVCTDVVSCQVNCNHLPELTRKVI